MPVVFVVAIRDRSDDCCCDSGGIEDVHVFDTMEDANRFCAWYVEDHRAINQTAMTLLLTTAAEHSHISKIEGCD
jgi:hypothetical protein